MIDRATDLLADFAFKGGTAWGTAFGTEHGHVVDADLGDQFVGHQAAGRGAFSPIERHAEIRTAGTTIQTRISVGHGRSRRKWGESIDGYSRLRPGLWKVFFA